MVKDDLIDAAEEVHDILGAAHTESTFHSALEKELSERGISFSSEGTIPILYKGSPVGRRRPDLFVDSDDGTIIVELKAGTNTGKEQLSDYENILSDDENFDINCGILIRFNQTVETVEIQSKNL